ncbi:hypothetical protein Nepgr_021743 [Nepenthes gracilis]|uniref:Rab-GAP TBC domain-containing protein n=1 Tax=Nepenthes gracilis TaxID=150966 RepID=A0AAD3XW68_NEPGR|nr:hypothetical protein Nepgr_021743 [Nepenthes gracilis]
MATELVNRSLIFGILPTSAVSSQMVRRLQAVSANFHLVGSMVRDMGDPCLHQSPIKVNKMLKPDKWQAAFDGDGKVFGFQKALKLIILGGVDPSIRPEVWEFLLGCYTVSSTAECRWKLRTARRERYEELIRQCQNMHSSVGTGSLAYIVGSKVMDMRTLSKDDDRSDAEVERWQASVNSANRYGYCDISDNCTDMYTYQRESSSDSSDLVSVIGSTDTVMYDSSCLASSPTKCNSSSLKPRRETHESQCVVERFFDFPALPVTDLFDRSDEPERACELDDGRHSSQHKSRFKKETMHSFQINNNEDLIFESNCSVPSHFRDSISSEIEMVQSHCNKPVLRSNTMKYKDTIIRRLRISDIPETQAMGASTSVGDHTEDRVSEWLWTLHRIVVDVVRTDSHLDFYEDPKNLARMSDILAVYAWVDPDTGYCQGMSDLLSPFIVLFEDNADAFWCFEMLLRRMRENFQMEGPTRVMKQLHRLWHILELTDREMFSHLSQIGAESLHFAFRMLLVLFRRELSFNEALCMWEMMWAADFDESLAWDLERKCLKPLIVQLSGDSGTDMGEETRENDDGSLKGGSHGKNACKECSNSENAEMKAVASSHSFCGLTKSFWSRNDRMQLRTGISSARNGEDELPVFCVAAILIFNRHKIIRDTHSIDDLIKIFNDNLLKIKVKRCIRTAIKLRQKYSYKLMKTNSPAVILS